MRLLYGKGDNLINRIDRFSIVDVIIYVFLIVLSFVMVYPVLYMFSLSLSSSEAVTSGMVKFLPVDLSFEAYKFVLNDPRIGYSYLNTIKYALLGTFFSLLFTSMMAYPLSVKTFALRKFNTILLTITMFFGGGLIPYYLIIKELHMINTLWVMVIPGAVSAWSVIIYRTFFQSIPSSLRESAFMDGANDIYILFKIILPLSKPLLATMALFSIVGIWNDYFTAMIFLMDNKKYPLQMILRSLVVQVDVSNKETAAMMSSYNVISRTIRAATITVAMIPIMCIYPFLQKYFAHGIMIGSIKG